MRKYAIAATAAIFATASFATIAEARNHDNHWVRICAKKTTKYIKKDGHYVRVVVFKCL